MTSFINNSTLMKPSVSISNEYYKATEKYAHNEKNIKNRTVSQTMNTKDYSFKLKDCEIIIMDTPGLNDVEGFEQDEINLNKIIDGAINSKTISGIFLIINGSNARITSNIKLLLTKFKGFVPDNIMENVIVIFTMCRTETCNIHDLTYLGIKPANVFYMNNSAFSSNPKKWNPSSIPLLEQEWNHSMISCNDILNFATSLTSSSTFEFSQMKTIRNNIKETLNLIQLKIMSLINIEQEYNVAKNAADKYNATAESFKDYTVQKKSF